ncbi:MAG: DUF4388 domain-containing protein [Acidobacteria bacterium]|nr:DUF4388 domain-containing protein [Acidobacteriota bacterium]
MGLAGNLSTMSLAEIFQWLAIGSKTGTLLVEGTGITKRVFFESGAIASANSSDPKELMGQFLISSNKLTDRQLRVALEMQSRDQTMLGDILLKQNILTKDELLDILRTASEEVIYDLFVWTEGDFEFHDGKMPDREIVNFNLDVTHIILEGVRRADEWGRIREVFPDGATIVRPCVDNIVDKLPLSRNDERLLRLVDGERMIESIAMDVRLTRFDVFKGLLDLFEAELIEVGSYEELTFHTGNGAKQDPIAAMLTTTKNLIDRGQTEQAEEMLSRLTKMAPQNPQTKNLEDALREKQFETTAKAMIRLEAVPELSMSVDAITRLPLSPEEGFVVSRVNGIWDVQSIIKIAPFDETVSLKIFKKFLDDGVVRFK